MNTILAPQYTRRESRWTDFCAHHLIKKFHLQFEETDGLYMIWGYDGPEVFVCYIYTGTVPDHVVTSGYSQVQNDADLLEWETSYLATSNQKIKQNVQTQFERDDLTLKITRLSGAVDGSGEVEVDFLVPGTPGTGDGRHVSGGEGFFNEWTPGDAITFIAVVDRDNLLGYGVDTVIATYHDDEVAEANRGWFIKPNKFTEFETLGYYGFIPAGLYLVVGAKKGGGVTTGTFYGNIEWGKQDV